MKKRFVRSASSAEFSYESLIRTPWIPVKAGEAQNCGTPINSVSAGHVIVDTMRKHTKKHEFKF